MAKSYTVRVLPNDLNYHTVPKTLYRLTVRKEQFDVPHVYNSRNHKEQPVETYFCSREIALEAYLDASDGLYYDEFDLADLVATPGLPETEFVSESGDLRSVSSRWILVTGVFLTSYLASHTKSMKLPLM